MSSGKVKSSTDLDSLSEIELTILSHISRFGLTTSDVWGVAPELKALLRSEVSAAIRKLNRSSLITSGWLHHGRHYFVLTEKGTQILGLINGKNGLLSESVKLRAYAGLLLVCSLRSELQILDTADVGVKLNANLNGLPNGFALMQNNPNRLAFIRVDSSPHAKPSRSAQSIRGDILRFAKHPVTRPMMQRTDFEYVWITVTQPRANSVLEHFRKYDRVGKSPITVVGERS